MFLVSTFANFRLADMLIQVVFLLLIISLIIGVIFFIIKFNKSNKRLDTLEEKMNNLSSDEKK